MHFVRSYLVSSYSHVLWRSLPGHFSNDMARVKSMETFILRLVTAANKDSSDAAGRTRKTTQSDCLCSWFYYTTLSIHE